MLMGLTQDRGAANLAEIGCIMIIMIVPLYNIKIFDRISFTWMFFLVRN